MIDLIRALYDLTSAEREVKTLGRCSLEQKLRCERGTNMYCMNANNVPGVQWNGLGEILQQIFVGAFANKPNWAATRYRCSTLDLHLVR